MNTIMAILMLPFTIVFGIVKLVFAILKIATMVILSLLATGAILFFGVYLPIVYSAEQLAKKTTPDIASSSIVDNLLYYINQPKFWSELGGTYLGLGIIAMFIIGCGICNMPKSEQNTREIFTLNYFRQLRHDQINGKNR